MITRRRRRRYMFLTMVLAFLTGASSFFITLEPAASEDSQLIDLWNDSFYYEDSQELMEVRVLSAEPSAVFSTCDGEMRMEEFCIEQVAAAEVAAAIENLGSDPEKAEGAKGANRSLEEVEREDPEEEKDLSSEDSSYEEESYDEEPYYEDSSDDDVYTVESHEESVIPVQVEEEESQPAVREESKPQNTDQSQADEASTKTEESAETQEQAPPAPVYPTTGFSDLEYLAAICQIEAGYNYEGCLAVANAVLNRLKAGYADSIYGVIFAPYQFATDEMGYYLNNGTGEDAMKAAQDAMNGINNLGDFRNFNGVYWLDPATLDVPYVVIGGNCFY